MSVPETIIRYFEVAHDRHIEPLTRVDPIRSLGMRYRLGLARRRARRFLDLGKRCRRAQQVQLAAVSQSKPAAQWPASDQAAKTAENFPLPVYASLGANPHFRDGLHLSDRQQRKLREISDRYLRKRQAFYERFQASFDALPSDDREAAFLKKTLQIREKLAKRFRKKIESVLSPEQCSACQRRFVADVLGQVLHDPAAIARWHFSAAQKRDLSRLDPALIDQRLALLSAAQRRRLGRDAARGGHVFALLY